MISVVIPARNEGMSLVRTVDSIIESRSGTEHVEIVVVDDASRDGSPARITAATPAWRRSGVTIKSVRLRAQVGVPAARNAGAAEARGEILVFTDAHVAFPAGWDTIAVEGTDERTAASARIVDPNSGFSGYGCTLEFPSMGTRWLIRPPSNGFVPIAPSAGTIVSTALFWRVGGYDAYLPLYGAAEPELSVRLWLSGARIVAAPELAIEHRFRSRSDQGRFQKSIHGTIVHNALRFALLYLQIDDVLRVIRYHASVDRAATQRALQSISNSPVWSIRRDLARRLEHDFAWYAERFRFETTTDGALQPDVSR